MPRAVLGLGGNLGARAALLRAATALFAAQPGLRIVQRSRVYENPPYGPPQPDFLNAALLVEWAGSVDALFAVTRHVEQLLGRERRERWGPRTIDIDLLLWSGGPVHTPWLDIPHPGVFERDFVLAPLIDLLPALASELSARLGEIQARAGAKPLVGVPLLDEASEPVGTLAGESAVEVLSALPRALARLAGAPSVAPRQVMPFALPRSMEEACALFSEHVRALWSVGFHVDRAAVTSVDAQTVRGVVLGAQVGTEVMLPRFALSVGSNGGRPDQPMWVRIASPA